ncbi:MAG TPA: hypothetical protein VK688_00150 [Gemmatimonadales bacterium]|jgi:hypothetical protein|nr:hypothetical protein [Gemmatimonadales bacterium]
MTVRVLTILAVAGAVGTAPTVKMRYRVDQTIEQAVDASAIGGGQQQQHFSVSTFLSVTLTDTTGGKVVSAVVDSMRADSAPVPKAVLDSARGTPFHGLLDAAGRVSEVKALRDTPLAPQLTDVITRLYPGLRAGLKVGDGWTDTTQSSSPASGGSMTISRITSYKATGTEDRREGKALKVETAFTSNVSGTQQTPGGPAQIEGSGSGTGAHYVGSDGRYLGGGYSVTTKLTLAGAFAPQPLPVTVTETFAVSALQ